MAIISCPNCKGPVIAGGYAAWQILISIILFPLGLLSLFAGRSVTACRKCGFRWKA